MQTFQFIDMWESYMQLLWHRLWITRQWNIVSNLPLTLNLPQACKKSEKVPTNSAKSQFIIREWRCTVFALEASYPGKKTRLHLSLVYVFYFIYFCFYFQFVIYFFTQELQNNINKRKKNESKEESLILSFCLCIYYLRYFYTLILLFLWRLFLSSQVTDRLVPLSHLFVVSYILVFLCFILLECFLYVLVFYISDWF